MVGSLVSKLLMEGAYALCNDPYPESDWGLPSITLPMVSPSVWKRFPYGFWFTGSCPSGWLFGCNLPSKVEGPACDHGSSSLTTKEANAWVYGIVDETPTDVCGGFVGILCHFDSILCSGILDGLELYTGSKGLVPMVLIVKESPSTG